MDIRTVQKTGNMHYVYLPTSWCKKQNISSKSKVTLNQTSNGSLTIIPNIKEKKEKELVLNINENSLEILHKTIVACYINPTSSFKINFNKDINSSSLLNQKRLVSLENVEISNKCISCESIVSISDPFSLLRTMVGKIKNLLTIMLDNYDSDIINRYESEIDKSKLLIEKSVISSLTFNKFSDVKLIDLYYVSVISKELERVVDNVILFNKKEKMLLNSSINIIKFLQEILESQSKSSENKLNYSVAIDFVKKISSIQNIKVNSQISHYKNNMANSFINISDVILDWAITNQLEGLGG